MDFFGGTKEGLLAISGKPVMSLISFNYLAHYRNLGNFTHSAETYSIYNEPYVIVSVAGAPSEEVPHVSVSVINPKILEDATRIGKLMFVLDAAVSRDVQIKVKLRGAAKKNEDYYISPARIIIPAGNISASVEVIPIDDKQLEGTETIVVKIKSSEDYRLTTKQKVALKIIDND